MKKETQNPLVEAIPEALLTEIEKKKSLLLTLQGRRDGYRKTLEGGEKALAAAEVALNKTVAAGKDGGDALRKIGSIKTETAEAARLLELTETEIERTEDALQAVRGKISAELLKAANEQKAEVTTELEAKISEIEGLIDTWRAGTLRAAEALGCDPPAVDIFLKGWALHKHLI